jgi:hypothetical protein
MRTAGAVLGSRTIASRLVTAAVLAGGLAWSATTSGCAQGRAMSDAAGGPRDASGMDAAIDFPDAALPDAPGLDAPFTDDAFVATMDAGSLDAAAPRDTGTDAWSPDAGRCTGTMCGGRCVDTTRDPMHCGGCDRPCSLPFASSTYVASRCTVATC